MSRLYYPARPLKRKSLADPTAAEFRSDLSDDEEDEEEDVPAEKMTLETFTEKLTKTIPTEAVAIFVFFTSLLETYPSLQTPTVKVIVYAAILTFIPLYFLQINKKHNEPIRNHIIVSSLAFLVWSYSIGGERILGPGYFNAGFGALGIALFSLFAPFVPLDK